MNRLALFALLGFLAAFATASAAPYSGQAKVTILLKSSVNSVGQPIVYPHQGQPEVTMLTVEIPPGQQTGWHRHPVPMFAYVLKGQVTVYLADGSKHTFTEGDAIAESVDRLHNGVNEGRETTKLLVVVTGEENIPFTVKSPPPPGR